ncbi:autotransporter domain-containing protein [Rhizobium puerariae]|uniref:Autotransporter domain-containing protein n=1 Tax=Rhizobium puerariae TaxID=1585791 RepID=A0ABV6ACD6_9HYPH
MAAPALAADAAAGDQNGTVRILSFNTWREYFNSSRGADASAMSDFLIKGDYDVIALQELCYISDCAYVDDIQTVLENAGQGSYQGTRSGEDGVVSRLSGTGGEYVWGDYFSGQVSYFTTDAQSGIPETSFVSAHFDWRDEPGTYRISEAQTLNAWAAKQSNPILMMGDFNAGDVSERGLHTAEQQAYLFARTIVDSGSSDLWRNLAAEYTPEGRSEEYQAYVKSMQVIDGNGQAHYRNVIQTYFDTHRSEYSGITSISQMSWRQWEEIIAKDMASNGLTFEDETFPVASNQPQTMNILKKQFMLLTSDSTREKYEPHTGRDGSTSWPLTDGENTATSWDYSAIDHFLASRPFGKWWKVVDDPNDPYLGGLKDTAYANDGTTPLSDHELVAHEVRWTGPVLEDYAGDDNKKTVIWSAEANTFEESGGVFYLTRNNMRTDVTLGQISDENGMPILDWLSDAEKKTRLDCKSTDPRLQAAIREYCIDDHSFIGETLVTDKGTVVVDEDAALGGASAAVRLDDGTLRIDGTQMTSLVRNVVLEAAGGTLDIADAANSVTAPGVISGTGALTKSGAGALNLTGSNTYTGATTVAAGALFVNGSIASSSLTTVEDGALLGGNGVTGDLRVADGGTLAPGNSIGTLTVRGDVTFDTGSIFQVEVDADGNSDKLIASGSVEIDGGTLATVAANGNYKANTSYTVITSGDGVTGTFDDVSTNMAFLTPSFIADGNNLVLNVTRNDIAFADVATTNNRRSVASAIQAFGPGDIYNAVVGLDAGTADETYRRLSGELYPSIAGALAENSHFYRDAVSARLFGGADLMGGGNGNETGRANIWSQAYGSYGKTEGNGVDSLSRSTGGFYFGVDTLLAENVMVGAMAGYGHTSFSLSGQSDSADADDYVFGLYGAARMDAFRFTFGGSYGLSEIDGKRRIDVASLSDTLTSGYNGSTGQIFGEAAYTVKLDRGMIEPFIGLAQVHVSTDRFSETGGVGALSVRGSSMDVTYMDLGIRGSTAFDVDGRSITLNGQIGWRHAYGDVTPETAMKLADSASFRTSGAPINEDSVLASAGINFSLSDNASVYVNYVGQFADESSSNGVNAGLKVRF